MIGISIAAGSLCQRAGRGLHLLICKQNRKDDTMETFKTRSVVMAVIWVVGLVTLAVPGVQLCGPTGLGGLAASALPLVTTLAVLAALSPSRSHRDAMGRVEPSPVGAV